jgi:hypothetical protein
LACRLSTRLREVLAERDAKDAEIARLKVEAVDRSGEWGWHVCRDGKIVKHAWIFCNRQCRPEGVQPLTGPVAELDSITAERDALKAQLAEAREKALDEASDALRMMAYNVQTMKDAVVSRHFLPDTTESTLIEHCAAAIRALKSGEREVGE